MSTIFSDRISKRSVQRLVRKWIKTLRSGKYRQGRGQLRHKAGKWEYCCLGVACDVIDSTGWRKEGHKLGVYEPASKKREPIEGRTQVLGTEALELLGLKPRANDVLARLNDEGDSFEEIATFIEEAMAKA